MASVSSCKMARRPWAFLSEFFLMPKINCWYRVLLLEMERGRIKSSDYAYFHCQAAAEDLIKFFLKKNEDIFSRIGHVPDYYFTAFNVWDIVDHIPDSD